MDRSRSRETGGTGLGLAIVKHVVQRHGARAEDREHAGRRLHLRHRAAARRACGLRRSRRPKAPHGPPQNQRQDEGEQRQREAAGDPEGRRAVQRRPGAEAAVGQQVAADHAHAPQQQRSRPPAAPRRRGSSAARTRTAPAWRRRSGRAPPGQQAGGQRGDLPGRRSRARRCHGARPAPRRPAAARSDSAHAKAGAYAARARLASPAPSQ